MANGNPLNGWQAAWNALSQAGGWVMTSLAAFLAAPPASLQDSGKTWYAFGQFVAAVLIGMAVGFRDKLCRRVKFIGIVLGFLIASIVLVIWFHNEWNARTCIYDDRTVVVGSEFTPAGKAYEKTPLSRDQILDKFAGKVEQVWTRESIDHNRTFLAILYMACVVSCTLCMAAVIQVPFAPP